MISSIVVGIILTLISLWISYLMDLASGVTIIIILAAVFIISFFMKKAFILIRRLKNKKFV